MVYGSAGGEMEIASLTSVLALVVSVVALVVTSRIAARQIRSARVSNETVVALDWLTRELINDAFLESEAYVLDRLAEEESAELGVSGLPTTARIHVLRVGRYYASLGHLVVFGVVDERLILSLVHHRIRTAWIACKPFVEAERKIRGAPFFAFFEHIAARASEVNIPRIHVDLGLRSFVDAAGPVGLTGDQRAVQPGD
ncbi:hypothetical protein [Dactylosporangium sp. NPDC049140]|uniref:DUF4760 domain-containing protein n=1 Tax=Dactylosporangium sp. NPDC049140 TaxID=3155647 RepID=UPI003401C761